MPRAARCRVRATAGTPRFWPGPCRSTRTHWAPCTSPEGPDPTRPAAGLWRSSLWRGGGRASWRATRDQNQIQNQNQLGLVLSLDQFWFSCLFFESNPDYFKEKPQKSPVLFKDVCGDPDWTGPDPRSRTREVFLNFFYFFRKTRRVSLKHFSLKQSWKIKLFFFASSPGPKQRFRTRTFLITFYST